MSGVAAVSGLRTSLSLENEILALTGLLNGVGLARVGLVIAIGAGFSFFLLAVGRWLKSSGLDPKNRIMRLTTLLMIGVFILVLQDLFRWFLAEVPLITLMVLISLLTLGGVSFLNLLRDLGAGVGLVLRQRIYPGVHLSIDGLEGVVARIGPMMV
jgi:hypothetical protein